MNWFVKIKQWQQFTGKQKVLATSDRDFVESIRAHPLGGVPTFMGIDYQVPLRFDFSLMYYGSDNLYYQTICF